MPAYESRFIRWKRIKFDQKTTDSVLYSTSNSASTCRFQNHNVHGTLECSESHTLREVDFHPDAAISGDMIS